MRPKTEVEIPLSLTKHGSDPLHLQVVAAVRATIHDGVWPTGHQVPSSRVLSSHLGVARSTVLAAYEQLVGEGYLTSRHGSGTFVSAHLPVVAAARHSGQDRLFASTDTVRSSPSPAKDLRPGQPDTSRIVDPAWTRAWRQAAHAPVPCAEPSLQGELALRQEVAEHLRVARGVRAEADQVFITAGTADGLALLIRSLGLDSQEVAVEDPGYPASRRVLTRLGCALRPIPVDGDGLDVEQLARVRPAPPAVLVTPSHQYPLGGRLPVERRASLLAWATEHDSLVIEDDYDSEFRFGVAPLPALSSLDTNDRVAHVGTFSKVLSPYLRLGYVLVPSRLTEPLLDVRSDLGTPVSGVDQSAMAAYLSAGALRRHISRARRDYAHRRDHLRRLLTNYTGLYLAGLHAGLHAVIYVPEDTDVAAVLSHCRSEGFLLADLAEYSAGAPTTANAVVLGYGAAPVADLDRAIDTLARAVHLVNKGNARASRSPG